MAKKTKRLQQANTYNVGVSQWRKWPDISQRVFNETYATLLHSQHLFLHPKADVIPSSHWKTTAWNSAWIAADATKSALDGVIAATGYES